MFKLQFDRTLKPLCYFLCLFGNWEPGIISRHCLACIAVENGKYRVQEFKGNVGGVLVLLQCTSTTISSYSAHPKTGTLQMIHRQAIVYRPTVLSHPL